MSATRTGKVVYFSDLRGFGFISLDGDPTREIFVHYSEIQSDDRYRTLKRGARVTFELGSTPQGAKAVNVRVEPLNQATPAPRSVVRHT